MKISKTGLCPYCNSDKRNYDNIDKFSGNKYREVECQNCANWYRVI